MSSLPIHVYGLLFEPYDPKGPRIAVDLQHECLIQESEIDIPLRNAYYVTQSRVYREMFDVGLVTGQMRLEILRRGHGWREVAGKLLHIIDRCARPTAAPGRVYMYSVLKSTLSPQHTPGVGSDGRATPRVWWVSLNRVRLRESARDYAMIGVTIDYAVMHGGREPSNSDFPWLTAGASGVEF